MPSAVFAPIGFVHIDSARPQSRKYGRLLLLGDADLGAHALRRLGVLAADDDHLVRFADSAAHSLGPEVVRANANSDSPDTQKPDPPCLSEEPFVEFPVVIDVEADVYAGLAHARYSDRLGRR